jgi:hypothetical protein
VEQLVPLVLLEAEPLVLPDQQVLLDLQEVPAPLVLLEAEPLVQQEVQVLLGSLVPQEVPALLEISDQREVQVLPDSLVLLEVPVLLDL